MSDSPSPPTLSVLTFNVWGLKFVSKDRTPRIAAIAEYIATHADATSHPGTGFDVVCLQECWVQKDYETIKSRCHSVFPYSRYFHTYVSHPFSFLQFPQVSLDVAFSCITSSISLTRCIWMSFPFSEFWRSYVASVFYALYYPRAQPWLCFPSTSSHNLSLGSNSGALGSGLAIFTRYPIISAQALPYSLSGLPLAVIAGDFFVNKAAGNVVILHPQLGEVEIWNTHVGILSDHRRVALHDTPSHSAKHG